MNQIVNVNETLAKLRDALKNPMSDDLNKAWVQSGSATSGLTFYDLQPGALLLYPVITPLRNAIARLVGGRGIQANWRAITGININALSVGVSQGNRGAVQASQTADYTAAFKGLGLEDYVTFEADYAAEGFDDVKSIAMMGLLRALMIGEEKVILGGLSTYGLGTTPRPTVADVGTGGTLAYNTTYSVICVALTMDGYLTGSVANGVRGLVSRTNADGSTDQYGGGAAAQSQSRTVTTANDSNNTHSLTASVAAVAGAAGYAWFWGLAGSEVLGAVTTINSALIAANATGTQTAASLGSNDNSANSLVFDGLLSQIAKAGSNSYIAAQATGTAGTGTPLTTNGEGGIQEIDTALQSFWDNYRLSPTTIWVNSQEQKNITNKVLSGTNVGSQRFVIQTDQGNVKGGDLVTSYLNKFSMEGAKDIPIKLHPNMPPGTILFDTDELPYPLSNVAQVKVMKLRRDYYSMAWPLKNRRWEYGTYMDGVLQNYFPPAFGVITNIGNG